MMDREKIRRALCDIQATHFKCVIPDKAKEAILALFPEWISMETPPDIGVEFIGTEDGREIDHYKRTATYEYFNMNSCNIANIKYIDYWMPLDSLPQPLKEG